MAPAAIDPYLTEWLNLALRFLHVVAAIAWIGSSFYFIALDNHLRPPKDERDAADGVGGEAWEIHGGGFYHVQKYRVAPPSLPEPLLWFKWEAYTTWLSGFGLMVVLYYANAETYLIDRSVADLARWEAIAISAAMLAGGWLVYDGLCRVLGRSDVALALGILALTAGAAYGASQVFGGRALYLHVAAMLGTIMSANVFFVIIPAHWELVRAKREGREPDAAPGLRGKQRSVHNNYLTLPVVFGMLAGHFPSTFSHEHAWLVFVVLAVVGAWIRHFFNLRHRGRTVWAIPVTAAAALVGVAFWVMPDDGGGAPAGTRPVPFAEARAIVERRCASCHVGSGAPAGVRLDGAERIRAQAEAIRRQAVVTRAMPPGNVTRMTEEERRRLGDWIRQGAEIP